jgi:hypothetical protein
MPVVAVDFPVVGTHDQVDIGDIGPVKLSTVLVIGERLRPRSVTRMIFGGRPLS